MLAARRAGIPTLASMYGPSYREKAESTSRPPSWSYVSAKWIRMRPDRGRVRPEQPSSSEENLNPAYRDSATTS